MDELVRSRTALNVAAWWDEPAYKTCNTLHLRGAFILRKRARSGRTGRGHHSGQAAPTLTRMGRRMAAPVQLQKRCEPARRPASARTS